MVERKLTDDQEGFVNFILRGGGIRGVDYVKLFINLYSGEGLSDYFVGYLNNLERAQNAHNN